MSNLPGLDEFRAFFVEEVEGAAEEIESTDAIPERVLKKVAELGAYRLTLPEQHGGFALKLSDYLPYLEASAEGPGAGRMLVHLTNGVWRPIAQFGSGEQQQLITGLAGGDEVVAFCLTERAGGTGRDLRSRAVRRGDDWWVTGEKHLITFADRATHFLLVVGTDSEHSDASLTAFLVPRDTEGFEIDVSQPTMGIHGTGHAFLRYENMRIPAKCRLGEVGQGLEVALSFLDYSRISLSTCMVGLAKRAMDEAVAFAKQRETFGKPIASRQAVQGHIADMHTDVTAARALVHTAAADYDAGDGLPIRIVAATAKLFCLNMVGRVTDLALKIHGGYGFTKAAPIERIYRDARGFWFEEGTQEIQRLVIARGLLDSG